METQESIPANELVQLDPEQEGHLANLDKARSAIAIASTPIECKKLGDEASTLLYYARRVGKSIEIQNDLAEIVIDSESRAGEILKDMAKSGARANHGQPKKERFHEGTILSKLGDLGVTKKQSSKWQQVAAVPTAARKKYIAICNEEKVSATTAGLLRSQNPRKKKSAKEENDSGAAWKKCTDAINDSLDKYWDQMDRVGKNAVIGWFGNIVKKLKENV